LRQTRTDSAQTATPKIDGSLHDIPRAIARPEPPGGLSTRAPSKVATALICRRVLAGVSAAPSHESVVSRLRAVGVKVDHLFGALERASDLGLAQSRIGATPGERPCALRDFTDDQNPLPTTSGTKTFGLMPDDFNCEVKQAFASTLRNGAT